MTLTGGQISIENNTIRNSVFGIYLGDKASVSKISYNNIENNSRRGNLYIANITAPIDAANNWWGLTDEAAIGQTIHDSKFDFNLAKVTYVPFLTAENTQAMPDQAAAIPVTQPTTHPTDTATPTEQPVSNPTKAPSNQPDTSSTPTQQPTSTVPSGANPENGLSSTEIIIAVLAVAVAILAVSVAVLWRKVAAK
jgi:parallel beta-helix repeat protein